VPLIVKPISARRSAHVFPTHLFLIHHGTMEEEEKASMTTLESISDHKFLQLLVKDLYGIYGMYV